MDTQEKAVASRLEENVIPDADEQFIANFPDEARKKLLRKIDIRILPLLTTLYLLSFLDRSNIANAKIEGLTKDLKMTSIQYNIALSTFFITYILFEVPCNVLLERYFSNRPSWWIGGLTIAWGICMTLHGIVQGFGGLTAVRLVMGIFEAGFFPAAVLLMNKWYMKFELSARVSIYYAGAAIAGAFSGLLAFAFANLDGVANLGGWRWIFLLEGIITVLIGVLVPILLPDTPEVTTKWLTEEERKYLHLRLASQDGGVKVQAAGRRFSWKVFYNVVTDWQFYVFAFVYWSNAVPGYGLKFTMPQIIKNMGYTSSKAQLLTIPPYFCGAVSAYVMGRLADKFKRRSYFLLIPQTCLIIAYSILTPLAPKISSNIGITYFGVIMACIGNYPITPGSSAWISNNLAGPVKRAIGLAYIFSINNVGSVGGSFIFQDSEAPSYPTGFGCSLAFSAAGMVAVCALDLIYSIINKRRSQMSEEDVKELYSDAQLAELGDKSPLFRYTL